METVKALKKELEELYPDIPLKIEGVGDKIVVLIEDPFGTLSDFSFDTKIPIQNAKQEIMKIAEEIYGRRMRELTRNTPFCVGDICMLKNLKEIRCIGGTMNLDPIFERVDFPERKYVLIDDYKLYTLNDSMGFEEADTRVKRDWHIDSHLLSINDDMGKRSSPIYVNRSVWNELGPDMRKKLSLLARRALDESSLSIDQEFQKMWDLAASEDYDQKEIEELPLDKKELFRIASKLEDILRNNFDDISVDDDFCQFLTRDDAKTIVDAHAQYGEAKKLRRENGAILKMNSAKSKSLGIKP